MLYQTSDRIVTRVPPPGIYTNQFGQHTEVSMKHSME
jgi:hypothetical protein